MKKRLSLLIICAASISVVHAQVLYNGLNLEISSSFSSTNGGATSFSGKTYGDEAGQLITDTGTINEITSVESYYDSSTGYGAGHASQDTALLVQVFNVTNGVVGSEVGEQLDTSFNEVDSIIQSPNFDYNGGFQYDVTATVAIGGLVSGNQYLVTMQAQTPIWQWLGVNYNSDNNIYVRDYSTTGAKGLYGTTTWTPSDDSAANLEEGQGDTQMQIVGATVPAPEPASITLISCGALALLRRRKKQS